jgi:hypothetical protein
MEDRPEVLFRIVMKILYRPFGIVLGIIAGFVAKHTFNIIWSKFDDEEAPKATQDETSWAKVLSAAAVQGMVFQTVRAAVNRGGAEGFRYLTGVWPGEKSPERK